MEKKEVYKSELEKLSNLFQDVEEGQKQVVQGLIEDAAFLYATNHELKAIIEEVGMVKIHPKNRSIQKQTEVGKQYLKNINSYAVVIKVLYSILKNNIAPEDDGFEEFMKEMQEMRGM